MSFLNPNKESAFPLLRRDLYIVTSPVDFAYNCIAHAAGCNNKHWWPVKAVGVDWPINRFDETIDCFIEAFATQGYKVCEKQDTTLESKTEKIALYVDMAGEPTHAARQLENGNWTSKLGEWEDIEHATLESLEGDVVNRQLGYGMVKTILRRFRQKGKDGK